MTIQVEMLPVIAGFLLSFAASYFPGVKHAYEKLDSRGKQLVMGGLIVIASVGYALWTCSASGMAACADVALWRKLVGSLFSVLVSNVATHEATNRLKKPKSRDIAVTGAIRPRGL